MAPLHKRFDGTDDSVPEAAHIPADPSPNIPSSNVESDESSGDDAPEAISTNAAANASLFTQKKIASTISHAATEAKTRRKAREEKLAAQTKTRPVKNKPKPKAPSLSDASESDDDNDSEDENSPPLLPLSVLAAAEKAAKQAEEAEFRASVPENLRKRKFLDAGEKKVRDVRVGRTTMRVLEKAPQGLAPKASGQSRSAREAWLRGRKGRGKGVEVGGRKVVGRGFAVK